MQMKGNETRRTIHLIGGNEPIEQSHLTRNTRNTTNCKSANTLLFLPCVIEESQNTLERMTKTATPNKRSTGLRLLFQLIEYGSCNATNGRIRVLLQ